MSDPRYDYRSSSPLTRAPLPEQNDGVIIAGAVAVLLVLGVIAYTMGGERLQTAVNPDIETTGRSERVPTPPVIQVPSISQNDAARRAGRAAAIAGECCEEF